MIAKYIYPEGMRFGYTTTVSKVHHIINPDITGSGGRRRSYCLRVFLNDDQVTDTPREGTRVCSHCSGSKHRTNIMVQSGQSPKKPKSTDINPTHYQFKLHGKLYEVADLMEVCFHDDMHLANAFKYLMRAGKKPTSSYISDVGKCLWWCAKAIMFHGGKSIELPPDAPVK